MREARREDRRGRSEPDRAPDLLARVHQAGGDAGLLLSHACERNDRNRDEGKPPADPKDDQRRKQVSPVVPANRELCKPEKRPAHQGEARSKYGLGTDPRHERFGDAGGRDDRERRRQHRHSRLEGGVAKHLLRVQRQQEEGAEHDRTEHRADDVPGGNRSDAPDRQRHQRVRLASFDQHEEAAEHCGSDEQSDRLGRDPADAGRLRDRVHEQHDRTGDGERAERVVAPMGDLEPAFPHHEWSREQHDCPDRDIHEEDPLPADVLRQDAAEDHPDRSPAPGERTPDTERLVPFSPLREGGADDRKSRWRDDRSADPLDGSHRDQRRL